jgi:polar amino acid transport system substrate-binding protein
MKDTNKILPPYGAARKLRGQPAPLAVEQRSGRMKTSAKTLCIGCTAAFLSGGSAWAQEACSTYVVVAGDNLRYIARQAYDDADLYRVIYEANVDTIGAKADLIEVGVTLNIPCDPRTATAAAPAVAPEPTPPVASAEAPAAVVEAAATPAAPPPAPAFPYRLVTGNGYAPFADEMLPGGGMFTQLVEMAIFRVDPAIPYNMTYINDWQAHIDALLPSGAYDISFPWVRPDCEAPETLSAGDLARCENFEFSAPFYEIVDGFFMPADSELVGATSYTAFEGKRVCRPEGYTTGVLDAVGLTAGKIELLRPIEVTDCFEALAAGKADLVSIDAEVGDSAIAELGMVGDFMQNPHLMTLDSLHVIAHKSNPRAVQMVRMLDQGIVEMYESGEWYDIVSSALSRGALQQ